MRGEFAGGFGGTHRGRDRVHLATWHDDLTQGSLGDLERPFEDVPLLGREPAPRGEEVTQLLLAHVLGLRPWIAASQADHGVGRLAQQPDRGPCHACEQPERSRGGQCPPLGALHRDPFRRELAEHQHHEREQDRHEHDSGRLSRVAEEPKRLDQRLSKRHRSGCRREETRQRDPDLNRREEAIRVFGQSGERLT
jgi:hypothetical protein